MKYLLIVIILVSILALSCTNVPDTPAVAVATVAQIEALQKALDKHTAEIALKANKTDLTASVSKDYVDLKVSSVAAPNMAGYYSKEEVNTAIANAITAYKATLTGGGTIPSGQTYTGGSVSIIYDPLSTVHAQPQYASNTATPQINFVIRFTNGTTQYQYVKPAITFSTNSAVTTTKMDIQMGSFTSPLVFTYNPNPNVVGGVNTTSVIAMATAGGHNISGEIQIQPGGYIDLNCWLQIYTNVGATWAVTIIPSSHP